MPSPPSTLGTAAADLKEFLEQLDDLKADFGRNGRAYSQAIDSSIESYDIGELPRKLNRLDHTMRSLKTELAQVRDYNIQLQRDNEAIRNSNTSSTELLLERSKNRRLQEEINNLKRQQNYPGSSTTGYTASGFSMSQAEKIDKIKDEKRDLEIQIGRLQNTIEGLERDKKGYRQQREDLKVQVSKLETEKADLQAEVDKLKPKEKPNSGGNSGSTSECRRCRERVEHNCPLAYGRVKFRK